MITELQLLTLACLACGLSQEQASRFDGDIDALLDYKFGMAFEDFANMARESQPFWALFPYKEPVCCIHCNDTKKFVEEFFCYEEREYFNKIHECPFCCES